VTDATSTATPDWQCIRIHESGDRYNDPSAPSGAYGIVPVTWASYGYSGWPYEAPPAVQDALALRLYNEYGWQPWSSRYACGL
jgi:muramidase (phage lysozyme)